MKRRVIQFNDGHYCTVSVCLFVCIASMSVCVVFVFVCDVNDARVCLPVFVCLLRLERDRWFDLSMGEWNGWSKPR